MNNLDLLFKFRCVIDIYIKYAYSFKRQKGITITNAFQKNVNEPKRKPNKIRVDKGSECYNRSIKSFLQKNDIEMHSTRNEENSVVTERFIRTLKNKFINT